MEEPVLGAGCGVHGAGCRGCRCRVLQCSVRAEHRPLEHVQNLRKLILAGEVT